MPPVPLQLGHITAVVQNRCGDDSIEFACQYYVKPEETHMGRQVKGEGGGNGREGRMGRQVKG